MDFLLPPKTDNWSHQYNPQTTPQKKPASFSASTQMTPKKLECKENDVIMDPTTELVKNLLTPSRKQDLKKILTPNSQKVALECPQSSTYYSKRRNKKMEFTMPDGSPFKPLQNPEHNEFQRVPLLELSMNHGHGNSNNNNTSFGFANNNLDFNRPNNNKKKASSGNVNYLQFEVNSSSPLFFR